MRILVADDEELIRWSLGEHLKQEGYDVALAVDGQEAIERFDDVGADALILDIKMPRKDGLSVLRHVRQADATVPVIMMTAHGAIDTAIEATQLGATAYLSKPFDLREVSLQLDKSIKTASMAREVHYLREKTAPSYAQLVGESNAMHKVFDTLQRLEHVDGPTVLVTGESGTGKDLVAQAIHAQGPRASEPYMAIDCASLPEQLIESELFGHERGAFTDAKTQKRGLFEAAHQGTIFLDEIGEMAMGTQAKLLRALETKTFRRVGGVTDMKLSAAIVAATNRDLKDESEAGRFRKDLYFRLNVVPIHIPPLRQRPEDIGPLAQHLTGRIAKQMRREIKGIDGEAIQCLERYRWPGNVRELRNLLERTVILHHDVDIIRLEHLPEELRMASRSAAIDQAFILPPDGVDLDEVEASLIAQALDRTGGNQSKAATLLGISRYALRYRIEKHEQRRMKKRSA